MKLAANDGFALQPHVEGELESIYLDMAAMASKAGLAKDRLVRHYSPPNVSSNITPRIDSECSYWERSIGYTNRNCKQL